MGFKWYAKCIARWQGSYRLIGSQLRNPQRFIPPTVTFLVLPTFAQQSTSEIVNLSLEDCIQLAYKKNNNLQITLLNESANQEIYKQSKLERLPNLNASLGETFTHSDSNGSNWNYDTYTP